jgi:hypothetical protein
MVKSVNEAGGYVDIARSTAPHVEGKENKL